MNLHILSHPTRRAPLLLCVVLLALGFGEATAQEKAERDPRKPSLNLEDIHFNGTLAGKSFRAGRWANRGPTLQYTEASESGKGTDLIAYNLESDEKEVLISGSALWADDVARLIDMEGYEFSDDGASVLLYTDSERVWRAPTKGFYYRYEFESAALTPLSSREKGFQMFAKFSPDASKIAFVRERNLFVVDVRSGVERALTDDGEEGGIINGTFDWVYEEEFGLRDGWSWSPNSQKIAFFKLDESHTRDFAMTDLRNLYPEYVNFRYPKAGERNSSVKIGVIDVSTATTRFYDTDTWGADPESTEYIARMGWTPASDGESEVWMMRLNRDQNDLDLLYGSSDGEVRTILNEKESTWIEVSDSKLSFLDDGKHFVWQTETSGNRHLDLYENDGTKVGSITSGDWDVASFHGIDEESNTAFFTAAIDSPLERQLYGIQIEMGTGDSETLAPFRISDKSGVHSVNLSADLRFYIDRFSDSTTPDTWTLHSIDGRELKVLEGNEELRELLGKYRLPAPEFTTVPGADGSDLNAFLIKPSDFDPDREYPLLMYVYGGPGSQTVVNKYGGSRYLWHAYLADELGIVVASVDNRGTGARGKAFKSSTYRILGQLEAADQIAAARHFGSLPYIDKDRIGIWGWSYGGYMTLLSMLYEEGPETFKLGVAIAPVTSWRLYDTIYTERYLSTPQKNPLGYEKGAPQHYAERLKDHQKLLIIHADFDDNVHFQNTVQMIDALQSANKQFDLMIYPGKNHSISGGHTRLNLFTKASDYIRANL